MMMKLYRTMKPAVIMAVFAAGLAAGVSGCVETVTTRIDSQSAATLPPQGRYALMVAPDSVSPVMQTAQQRAIAALARRGWQRSDDNAPYLLTVTVSQRPAALGLNAKSTETTRQITPAKQQRFLQSCDDAEHRVSIILQHQKTGASAYSGHAAEYHCKAHLEESLPFLVDAALEDWGQGDSSGQRTSKRAGRE